MDIENLSLLFGYVSIFYISCQCLFFLWIIFRCYCLTSIGFVKDLTKYGEWVVVTGATDGIGKEYARQFAKQGFKIVLISRTKVKLEKVGKEIEDEFNVETKMICFDFTQSVDYDDITKVITGLDVGILVNNVGMSMGKYDDFTSIAINNIKNGIYCNIFANVNLTHMILRGMLERKRGFIIHVSSASIFFDKPYSNIYPGTKMFIQKFFKSLQLEHCGIVDHQLVTPFYVATNMCESPPCFTIPSAKDYVESAVKTIGIMVVTCGCFSHEIQKMVLLLIPRPILLYILRKTIYKKGKGE